MPKALSSRLPVLTFILFLRAASAITVGSGPEYDFPTITSALSNAQYGETLFVADGVYDTTRGEVFPLLMKSGVDLVRLEPDMLPTIRGTGNDSVLVFDQVNDASLSGFRITGGGGLLGGGIRCTLSAPHIEDCVISNNRLASEMYFDQKGAGLHCDQASPHVARCVFRENSSTSFRAGVIYCTDQSLPYFRDCRIQDNSIHALIGEPGCFPRLYNCLITDNGNPASGGSTISLSFGRITLFNCTIAGNYGGGVEGYSPEFSALRNCILWNHGPELSSSFTATPSYCCIRGGASGIANVDAWPGFADPEEGDWRLADGSPCINRGASGGLPAEIVKDLSGEPRVQGAEIDIGAFESPGNYAPGDPGFQPRRWHVTPGGKGSATGVSWEEAFGSVESALFRTSKGSEIWIASGTYRESASLIGGITVTGGFAGDETSIEERPIPALPTILDATGLEKRAATLYSMPKTLVDGLTFTGGDSPDGGGIGIWAGNLHLRGCIIMDNHAPDEGSGIEVGSSSVLEATDCVVSNNRGSVAISCESSSNVRLTNCRVEGNESPLAPSAILMVQQSHLILRDCAIRKNSVSVLASSGVVVRLFDSLLEAYGSCISENEIVNPDGRAFAVSVEPGLHIVLDRCDISNNVNMGGVCGFGSPCYVNQCTFRHNTKAGLEVGSGSFFGTEFVGNGRGALHLTSTTLTRPYTYIEQCIFKDNGALGAQAGGLLANGQEVSIYDCRFIGNKARFGPAIQASNSGVHATNCLIAGNQSGEGSRSIYLSGTILFLQGCTVADNSTAYPWPRVSIEGSFESNFAILNTILWDGTDPFFLFRPVSTPTLSNSNISDPTLAGASGNISADPLFVMPWNGETGDWHLQCGSPSIDSGTTTQAPDHDLDGNPRPIGAGVDMGAYENCLLDLNQDGKETPRDLVLFPPEWYRGVDSSNQVLDMTADEELPPRIDAKDLAELLEEWE